MIRDLRLLGVLFGALLAATPARAQGYDRAAGGGADSASSRRVLTAVSDRYEVLLKYDALQPGTKTDLDLYLSDFQTNAPVAGAAIALSLRAGSRELWNGTAQPADKRPGVYTVPFRAPPDTGTFNMLVTVQRLDDQDRFALSGMKVNTGELVGPARSRRGLPWLWLWLVGAAVLVLTVLLAISRRRVRVGSAPIILGILFATVARAHEGHDKTPAASGVAVGPGAQVYVAKPSQFLLGIRTQLIKREPVQKRLTVFGRVAPRGGGEVEIVAPQSGRIYFSDGRTPVMGQSVFKGQAVARLTVVDDLDLRAPLSGVLTGVFVVNGQLVEAGQKLMTLLDPSVVWVHADVYEADVPAVQRATRAVITSQATPDLAVSGRKVAMGVTQGEVLGTVEAWFEAPNAGGRLKVGALVEVGIELGGAEPALVVPRSAIFEKDGRKLVFIHSAPERFTAREVTLGTGLGVNVVVSGDLTPGDRIVTAGGYPLLTAPVVSLGH